MDNEIQDPMGHQPTFGPIPKSSGIDDYLNTVMIVAELQRDFCRFLDDTANIIVILRCHANVVDCEDVVIIYLREVVDSLLEAFKTTFEARVVSATLDKDIILRIAPIFDAAERYGPGISDYAEDGWVYNMLGEIPDVMIEHMTFIAMRWESALRQLRQAYTDSVRPIIQHYGIERMHIILEDAITQPLTNAAMRLARQAIATARRLKADGLTGETLKEAVNKVYYIATPEGAAANVQMYQNSNIMSQLDDLPTLSGNPEDLGLR